MSLDDIRSERIKKLEILKEKGVDPYPLSANRDFLISEALKDFSKLSKKKKPSYIAGRIMAIREHGGSIFFDIYDGSTCGEQGRTMQAYIKKDEIGLIFLKKRLISAISRSSTAVFLLPKRKKKLLRSRNGECWLRV